MRRGRFGAACAGRQCAPASPVGVVVRPLNFTVRCHVGSEIIVFLVPVGFCLLLFLGYRIIRGPLRIYPTSALVVALAWAGYLTSQQQNHYFDWFFISFTFVLIPVGTIAHVAKWLIERRSAQNSRGP